MNLDRIIRYVAFGWATVSTLLAATFTAVYAMNDPGGWRGVALILVWLIPLALLSVAAARWPRRAVRPLTVAVAAVVLLELATVLLGTGWADVEGQLGPIRAVAVLTLAGPLAVLGLRRPFVAGQLSPRWASPRSRCRCHPHRAPPRCGPSASARPSPDCRTCCRADGMDRPLQRRDRPPPRRTHPRPRRP